MKAAARRRSSSRDFAKRYLRDASGIASIEFVFVAFISIVLILGTLELAVNMIVDATVQAAAQEASRVGITTSTPATGTRQDAARKVIDTILGGWKLLGATVEISALNYGTYGNLSNPAYKPTSDMGGLGEVIAYNIKLTMPGITGIPGLFGIDTLTFQRNYIVQNEK
ncbi:TadE-like protein [Caballeronia catudaia]|uniref:TadE-like protein n=1 Tax=Caballeronia catudaia TaxID=1777136 RepID=A0A158B972_9BURK|nr:TadE/TadG family type IV pilus assembly protein [Caballeronia catudaia]SAK66625.1 TadE-like protein [Caballeronia catudaia]